MHRCVLATVLLALLPAAAGAQLAASPSPLPTRSAVPSAAPSTPEAPAVARVDGAFSLPGGIWKCETLGNSQATSVYKLENPTTISERTTLQLPKRAPIELNTLFTYSPKTERWTASLQNGSYAGTAPVWSGDTWTFDGIYVEGGEKRAVRLVYTSLGEGALRIDYQAEQQAEWRTFSGATCKRTIP